MDAESLALAIVIDSFIYHILPPSVLSPVSSAALTLCASPAAFSADDAVCWVIDVVVDAALDVVVLLLLMLFLLLLLLLLLALL